jgi:hypothetical protein
MYIYTHVYVRGASGTISLSPRCGWGYGLTNNFNPKNMTVAGGSGRGGTSNDNNSSKHLQQQQQQQASATATKLEKQWQPQKHQR